MADEGSARTRQQGLQQAASVIFALVAVVPMLIFAWTLHSLGAIRSTQAQLALGLALAVSLLGFWMFRSMLGRMAEVVQALTAAVEQAHRGRRPPSPVAAATPAPVAAPAATTAPATSASPVTAAAAPAPPGASPTAAVAVGAARPAGDNGAAPAHPMPAVAPRPSSAPRPAVSAPRPSAVAGIGKIRELTEVVRTMDALWLREATAHLNQRVQISVANSREPLVGVLTEASADGLILEQADGAVAVAYGRVTAIDRLA
jgi:hypothetical protein